MSNITLGLGILGGLVLAGVVAHGAWTTHKAKPKVLRTEHARDLPERDPLADSHAASVRIEPMLGGDAAPPSDSSLSDFGFVRSLPATARTPGLDALIDAVARIGIERVISGDLLLSHMPGSRRAGTKPFLVEGFNEQSQSWEAPQLGQRYAMVQAGVQLANRAGPLNDIEFSEFAQITSQLADALDGSVQNLPDMREEVARARELDAFAASHDAQLSITVRAKNAAWSLGFVQLHAQRKGFVAGAVPGRLVLPSSTPGLPPVLVLALDTQAALADPEHQVAIRHIALSLDVPTVDRAEQPFVRMRDVSIALAAAMEGSITDERGTVLMSDALDAIGADLEALYDALEARDLAAGSAQARRLFS